MLSIRDIISHLNEVICDVLPGAKLYGVAYTAVRGTDLLPVIDEKYVGLDDTYPISLYHKINGWQTSKQFIRSYGNSEFNTVNTYSLSMIVFNRILNPDELALLIQSAFPNRISSNKYKSVLTSVTSVILNSQQVYGQEYRSDTFRLSEKASLFQINYSLEVTFNGCLDLCPEDFLKLKN